MVGVHVVHQLSVQHGHEPLAFVFGLIGLELTLGMQELRDTSGVLEHIAHKVREAGVNLLLSVEVLVLNHVLQSYHVGSPDATSVRRVLHLEASILEGTSSYDTRCELLVSGHEEHHVEQEEAELSSVLAVLQVETPQEELQEPERSGNVQLEVHSRQKFNFKVLDVHLPLLKKAVVDVANALRQRLGAFDELLKLGRPHVFVLACSVQGRYRE